LGVPLRVGLSVLVPPKYDGTPLQSLTLPATLQAQITYLKIRINIYLCGGNNDLSKKQK
jgi:hypothetical protein